MLHLKITYKNNICVLMKQIEEHLVQALEDPQPLLVVLVVSILEEHLVLAL